MRAWQKAPVPILTLRFLKSQISHAVVRRSAKASPLNAIALAACANALISNDQSAAKSRLVRSILMMDVHRRASLRPAVTAGVNAMRQVLPIDRDAKVRAAKALTAARDLLEIARNARAESRLATARATLAMEITVHVGLTGLKAAIVRSVRMRIVRRAVSRQVVSAPSAKDRVVRVEAIAHSPKVRGARARTAIVPLARARVVKVLETNGPTQRVLAAIALAAIVLFQRAPVMKVGAATVLSPRARVVRGRLVIGRFPRGPAAKAQGRNAPSRRALAVRHVLEASRLQRDHVVKLDLKSQAVHVRRGEIPDPRQVSGPIGRVDRARTGTNR